MTSEENHFFLFHFYCVFFDFNQNAVNWLRHIHKEALKTNLNWLEKFIIEFNQMGLVLAT